MDETGPGRARPAEMIARVAEAARRTDGERRLLRAVRVARQLLPGDSQLGDPLSIAGSEASQLFARRLAEGASERPSVVRELGLGAVQVWQAVSEAQGRGRGEREVAILFTDLVEFSSWALEAGDEASLELLRHVGKAVEPAITERKGDVVKRMGDGLMAVFGDPQAAIEAAHEAVGKVGALDVAGHRPALRAGLHLGRPRRLGGDYLGVDVNIAARVAQAASGGEVLVSEAMLARLDPSTISVRRQRRFRAKGAPRDLEVFAAEPR